MADERLLAPAATFSVAGAGSEVKNKGREQERD